MSNDNIPKEILDRANRMFTTDGVSSYIQGSLDERKEMFEFMEWVNRNDIQKSAQRGFWIVGGKNKVNTQQLHTIWQTNK